MLGKAKGVIAVVLSLLIFRNRVKWLGMVGYSMCVAGVFCYSEAKRRGAARHGIGHARGQGLTVAVDQVGVGGGLATPAASPSRPNRQSEDVALGEVSLHVRHMHGGKAADDASKRTW